MFGFLRKLFGLSGPAEVSLHPALARLHDPDSTPAPLESVLAGLSSKTPDVRRTAAYALGDYGEPEVVPKLLELIHDPDLYVRVYAIQSLGRVKSAAAVLPLCELLAEREPEALLCSNVLRVLAELRDHRALPTLMPLLSSENAFVRYDAAHALGEIGHPDAIPGLESLLADGTMPESSEDDDGGGTTTLWSVGENARRAIAKIRSRNPPE